MARHLGNQVEVSVDVQDLETGEPGRRRDQQIGTDDPWVPARRSGACRRLQEQMCGEQGVLGRAALTVQLGDRVLGTVDPTERLRPRDVGQVAVVGLVALLLEERE